MRYYFNPGKVLRQMFPEQTKTWVHIVIWTIVFIADLFAVHYLLQYLGLSHITNYNFQKLYLFVLIGGGLLVFWLETAVYNKIIALFR